MSVVALDPARPLVLGDLVARSQGRATRLLSDVLLVAGAAAFVGALAQMAIRLPFTPVPITGQTLGVLLAGTALGWRRAAASMAVYAIAGVAGIPWFADHASGYVGASFGYVVGFFFAATACGFLASRGADRSVLKALPAMLVGEIIVYAFGLTWLALDLRLTAGATLKDGFTPFIAGDSIKCAIAAGLLPAAWKIAGLSPRHNARAPASTQD
jgi:biotin transport system substrate-specific component